MGKILSNTEGITVLSLFDGMSCGQIALKQLGIKVKQYYAAEIDNHAIKQTQLNFTNTIQLGDVTKVFAKDLPKIDLLIGGSPCQGFSFAGKQLSFDDPRSKLFFEFVRLKNECNPDYFMLENVKMKKEHELVISQYMKVAPIEINSDLVSAQNRVRLYWTNINEKPYGLFGDMMADIQQPKDKGILLKDILESDVAEKYFLSDKCAENFVLDVPTKSYCIDSNYYKGASVNQYLEKHRRQLVQLNNNTESGGKQPYQQNRVYDTNGISPALMAQMSCGSHAILEKGTKIRRLTPTECARLQTIPDWYIWKCSDTQQYRMLGNGWTVDVIAHIFSFIK